MDEILEVDRARLRRCDGPDSVRIVTDRALLNAVRPIAAVYRQSAMTGVAFGDINDIPALLRGIGHLGPRCEIKEILDAIPADGPALRAFAGRVEGEGRPAFHADDPGSRCSSGDRRREHDRIGPVPIRGGCRQGLRYRLSGRIAAIHHAVAGVVRLREVSELQAVRAP